jgi:ComF family protein
MSFLTTTFTCVNRHALDGVMPRACVLCGEAGVLLCPACRDDATASMTHGCLRCALPLQTMSQPRLCGRCLRRPPAYDQTCAAAAYAAPFEQLVRGLKYGATLAYAPLLADLLDARARVALGADLDAIDVLLPVPLSRERMASRGFNQAIEIGRVLARRWRRPLDTASVLRIHDTPPQAGLRLAARRRNVRRAFAVIDARRDRLTGRCVGVVDDVMTSGATLDEFARTLKRAGVARVFNLVVARRC